jgi:N-acetylglutamate synthase-like GNAT family acetyltransferase
MKIVSPSTPEEFEKYYQLRWEVLRAPWGKPRGSEKDELEYSSTHALMLDDMDNAVGVCRLNTTETEGTGQVRFMGVSNTAQGKGYGAKILSHIEQQAKLQGMKRIILHARENALEFYKRCGYREVEKSYLMWGEIQHTLMEKVF